MTAARALLLDIDGTLLDSNDAHTRAWMQVLKRHGHEIPYERVRPLIGKGGDKLLEELVGLDDDAGEGKQMSVERQRLFASSYLETLVPTPGARDLLLRVRDAGLRLVVATSAGSKDLDGLLRQAGIADLIDAAADSGDVEASKPDPDIVIAAIRRAGVPAADCVMLGDTPHDIAAARAAGVDTIALRCGGWWSDDDLHGAIAIHDDPRALLRVLGDFQSTRTGSAESASAALASIDWVGGMWPT